MKKPDLFVQKIGSSFFNNDILPQSNSACAQNFFKRRFLRVARNASTHERAHKILPPKLLFIEDFCRDFCARQEVCGFCDGNLQNVKDQAKTQARRGIAQKDRKNHSHSMVAGGFEVISYTTRLTPSTSLMMRLEVRPSRS